jgi:hypothetical protein
MFASFALGPENSEVSLSESRKEIKIWEVTSLNNSFSSL